MHRIGWIALALALGGCGSSASPAPAPTESPRAVEPALESQLESEPENQPSAPLALPEEVSLPYRWFERTDRVASFGASLGVSGELSQAILDDPRTYTARREGDAIVVRRSGAGGEVWSVTIEGPFTSEPVIADLSMSDDAIVIAAAGGDGWIMEARGERDGARRWRASAAFDPDEGDAVQLGTAPRGVAVYVRAASGDLVDLVDEADGEPIGRRTFATAVTRVALDRPESASIGRAAARGRWPARDGTFEATARDAHLTLHRVRGDARELVWGTTNELGCLDLALAEDDGEIAIAAYCRNATGVTVYAVQLAGALERWVVHPFGYGPIAHSRWSNEVAIAIEGPYVRVWGAESGGRYVSTIDRATGRELATLVAR